MTGPDRQKRLDAIEDRLTPKELAIKLADEMRKHPSEMDFMTAVLKGTYRDSPLIKPFIILADQAEEIHPGRKPDEIGAKIKLNRKLRHEYQTLKLLIFRVNDETKSRIEKLGTKAALKLATLQTVILQDAFGRTAKKAAEWIEEYKAEQGEEEEARRVMLKELSAYTDADFSVKLGDFVPLGIVSIRLPSVIEEWVDGVVTMIVEVFLHLSAVKAIQDKYFDGHPILFVNVEAGLTEAVRSIEDAVATFNDYLKTRAELFKAEWDQETKEDGIASAMPGEREGTLAIDIAAIRRSVERYAVDALASSWTKQAKDWATSSMMDEMGDDGTQFWQQLRDRMQVQP